MKYEKESQKYILQKVQDSHAMSFMANDAFVRNEFKYINERLRNIVGDITNPSEFKICINKVGRCKGRMVTNLCAFIEILEAMDKISMVSNLDLLKPNDLCEAISKICDKYSDLAYAISSSE